MGDHWNEGKLKPSDQKEMARECAALIPSDARELRLDYRDMDVVVDVLHYRTKQSLSEILKDAKTQWEVTGKTENYASLEWRLRLLARRAPRRDLVDTKGSRGLLKSLLPAKKGCVDHRRD